MAALERGTASNNGTTTPQTVTLSNVPGRQSYVLVVVGLNALGISVTSITGGTGTFVKLGSGESASQHLELWLGYNFGTSAPTTITVTRPAGSTAMATHARVIDLLADASTLPSYSVNSPTTGTGTSIDSGSVTPAVGDLLFAANLQANNSSSSARTHTGNTYLQNSGVTYAGSMRAETGWCEAAAAVASKEVWTIAISAAWVGLQAAITPPAPPSPTSAILLKGLTTQALDAASAY